MLATRAQPDFFPDASRFSPLVMVVVMHLALAWLLLLTPAREVIRAASVTMVSLISAPRPAAAKPEQVPRLPIARAPQVTVEVPPLPTILVAAGDIAPVAKAGPATPRADSAHARETANPQIEPPQFDLAYLKNPPPAYPALSKRLREQGRVLLRVRVSAEGAADQIEIQASSGLSRLDTAAIEAVRQWRFVPARRGVDAVSGWALVPINFQLS